MLSILKLIPIVDLLQSPAVRERRRFTDVMDEEIDDERKARINTYGADNAGSYTIRRLRRELGKMERRGGA